MRTKIVHGHDVAVRQSGYQHLTDILQEQRTVDRSVKHERRGQTVMAQGGDESLGFPVPVRRLVDQPLAALRSSGEQEHIGLRKCFINEYEFRGVQLRLLFAQDTARLGDVRPILFGGVNNLF